LPLKTGGCAWSGPMFHVKRVKKGANTEILAQKIKERKREVKKDKENYIIRNHPEQGRVREELA
jgi:hypothetical protein